MGLSDAALQVVQACVPDRSLMSAACDSVSFSDTFRAGRKADGGTTILVTRETAPESEPGAPGQPDAGRSEADRQDDSRSGPDRQDDGGSEADGQNDGRSAAGRRGSGRPPSGRNPLAGSGPRPRTAAAPLNRPP